MTGKQGIAPRSAWLLMAFAALLVLMPLRTHALSPDQGPGGPILVVTSSASPIGKYYAEILRTEGFQNFAVADISTVSATSLGGYDVVILAKMALTSSQVTVLTNWVTGGGRLIAMAPDAQLAGLLGVSAGAAVLSDGYMRVDTSRSPGNGIYGETMQFHGAANRYTLAGATSIATLYTSATTATANPAVTLNVAGLGQAAAFAFDLATSIAQTRQGNPAWAAQERDGVTPIRSDDKFYGNAAGDPQADWVDLDKVAVPQADEQQRLLANLIVTMNAARRPLPRFWYFPKGSKAVVVMTGDDHGNGGTAGRFDQLASASTAGCDVAQWQCIRATSYIYPSTPLTDAQAGAYTAAGFEIGVHINTNCQDFTATSLESTYNQQLGDFSAKYASVPSPSTERHHCIVWSDWATAAKTMLAHGMRLDLSYYYWPASWVNNVPGMFTGSAMPMRLTDTDGSLIDVFEATTHMTDESGQTYPFTVDALLDRAVGNEGYYGVYPVNAHTDTASSPVSDAVVASARARNVPIVSALQLLRWLDARNKSTFSDLAFDGTTLRFTIVQDPAAIGLQALVPSRASAAAISGISRNGAAVPFSTVTIKGITYATFAAAGGAYVAAYAADTSAPTVTATTPAASATNVSPFSQVTATFSEAMDAATISTATFELRDPSGSVVAGTVTYDPASMTAAFAPGGALAPGATYTATIKGGASDPRAKDLSGVALAADKTWSFTTSAMATCPCSAWSAAAVPAHPAVADPSSVELGVKFRTDVAGTITAVRFYKGSGNGGTHIGNLWTSSGQRLATATFADESASGWQQVNFAQPVAVGANTVYVASYFAPLGNYAGDNDYFTTQGVDNAPIHLLADGASGGNGVYGYGASSAFPSSSYRSTNYWVDVVFVPAAGSGGSDTTPPSVTSTLPANGTTNVPTTTNVTVTFNEALDATTVTSSTFALRDASNAPVAARVAYDATTRTATLTPNAALAAGSVYTASVVGGTSDPRIKDLAGNALASSVTWSFTTVQSGSNACASPPNAIVAENCLPGNPASEWDVSGAGDTTIQGFATDISVDRGGTISFKVKTTANAYRFDIYRLGYYAGSGARRVATVQPSAALPQSQPSCLSDTTTGLIDCGNWSVSASWTVPTTAASGIYIARVVRSDTGGASHIPFVVRDDAGRSDVLFQTSDTTWQAYNNYGGNSLYQGGPGTNPGRAYKVSYNRPFNTRAVDSGQDYLFNAEYPMVRWLEANGYDVSYTTGVDSDRRGSLIRNHKAFLSVGHDEYWSGPQRANVEAARDAGVHLAFLSGNEIFWKTRFENSIDPSATAYRTLASYKETHADARIDPADPRTTTATWLDPRFGPGGSISPSGDGGRPGNALAGTMYGVNDGATSAITVPAADGRMRLWRGTSIATLAPGTTATLPNATLGYEWDIDADNGSRPAGLVRNSTTTVSNAPLLQDYGSTYAPSTATHHVTFYRHASGARVFGAGSVQWSWGLDANHDRAGTQADVRMQQATVNLLADMNVQPATLQSGLIAASASTDTAAPTSAITSPASGATVGAGSTVTISGTATDTGGVVGAVEVSVDGGATWHPANGRDNWTYAWTPAGSGNATLRSRAADDSGNLEPPGAGVTVTIGSTTGGGGCPCSIWPASTTPGNPSLPDGSPVNLGVRFSADQSGYITGIRFYKGPGNTGTHVGALWNNAGQQLAIATFVNESASGWQQVNFPQPVAISANTPYVASYFAPNGNYAVDRPFFATAGVDAPPLHALQDGVSGNNGIFAYASGTTFPTSSYQASNYWVDVVFTPASATDTTPPAVTATSPGNGAVNVPAATSVTATFSEAMNASTITTTTFELRDPANTVVAAGIVYNASSLTATLTPNAPLAAGTTYRATVLGGATDPRVKDAAGNALAASVTWTFTTAAPVQDTTPPTITTVTPKDGSTGVNRNTNVTVRFSEPLDASSVTTATVALRNASNQTVNATVSLDSTRTIVTLDPVNALASRQTFTATVLGGAGGVRDVAGNALSASKTWTFSTR